MKKNTRQQEILGDIPTCDVCGDQSLRVRGIRMPIDYTFEQANGICATKHKGQSILHCSRKGCREQINEVNHVAHEIRKGIRESCDAHDKRGICRYTGSDKVAGLGKSLGQLGEIANANW